MPTKSKAIGGSVGAGAGSGLGGAVATLIMAIWWPDASQAVAGALTTVCGAVLAVPLAFLGAYLPSN